VVTIMQHRLEDRVHVQLRYGQPEVIQCEPSLFNQAVMNLIANAIDAIEGNGLLTITTGADGSSYVIRVEDTGIGIPTEIRERVFEPFFTTKPIGQGTGLGLSIAYSIVRKHGGTLELHATAAGGTEAVIRIPNTTASAVQAVHVGHTGISSD
jgi:two-component system NtrC family sensor kinase